jgi:hypothetical protein
MGLTSWCNIFHHTGMQSETNAKVISFVQSSMYGVVLLLLFYSCSKQSWPQKQSPKNC